MKIAYFCEPQIGGTFSFFTRVRPHLANHGIDFRCIPPMSGDNFGGKRFESIEGVDYVQFPEDDLTGASRVLIEHLEKEGYEAVMILPGCDIVASNLVRYLPRSIRATARVPMITRGTYAPTQALARHLDVVFAVSDRVKSDLVSRYRIPSEKVEVVYNGVEVSPKMPAPEVRNASTPFNLFYSGRLSDLDKGVLLLPEIMRRITDAGVDAELKIVGTGPDCEALKCALQALDLQERVKMLGAVPLAQVVEMLTETDCFVLPSRFEGCPNALIEAMAAGRACVAARIRGSVDQIIEHGKSGLLAEVADPASFADAIVQLAEDPELMQQVGLEARRRILERFTIELTASKYAEVLHGLRSRDDQRSPALSVKQYSIPRAMKPTWRTLIPVPVKNFIRKRLERFGISS